MNAGYDPPYVELVENGLRAFGQTVVRNPTHQSGWSINYSQFMLTSHKNQLANSIAKLDAVGYLEDLTTIEISAKMLFYLMAECDMIDLGALASGTSRLDDEVFVAPCAFTCEPYVKEPLELWVTSDTTNAWVRFLSVGDRVHVLLTGAM